MTIDLKNRHFLKLLDYTPDEIKYLLDLSMKLKKIRESGNETQQVFYFVRCIIQQF